MLGGIFPLVSRQFFHNVGYGAAASIMGGIGFALCLVPWVLVFFGPTIRAKSKYATVMNQGDASTEGEKQQQSGEV